MTNMVLVILFLAGTTLLVAKGVIEPLLWRSVRNWLMRDLVRVGLRPEQARRLAEKSLRNNGWHAWW